jgi:hypothetical protein
MSIQRTEPILIKRYARSRLYDPVTSVMSVAGVGIQGSPIPRAGHRNRGADVTQVLIA